MRKIFFTAKKHFHWILGLSSDRGGHVNTLIPKQLQDNDFRFCLIHSKQKIPFETGWTTKTNYKYNDKKLLDHIQKERNHGIVCGNGNLAGCDADDYELQQAIEKNLPETFTVKSGGTTDNKDHPDKLHYYYKLENELEKTIDLSKTVQKTVDGKLKDVKENVGHIRWTGGQLVCPNSIHESGKEYVVFKDLPIATITKEKLLATVSKWLKKLSGRVAVPKTNTAKIGSLKVEDIVATTELTKKSGGKFQGAHPFHESTTKWNFELDTIKNQWYCFNHEKGGGALELIAMEKGLLDCEDCGAGALKGDKFIEVLEIAHKDYGLDINLEKDNSIANLEATPLNVVTLISMKKNRDATELLAKAIEAEQTIFTTRSDEKPEMWIYKDGIYISQAKSFIKEHCRKILGQASTVQLINEVIFKIETDTYINAQKFFETKNINEICLQNGVLNLKTRKLEPFNPKKVFFSKLPIDFEPTAKCPIIQKHFETVLKHPQDAIVMFELFGFCLYKEYSIAKAFMLTGTGRNGKSVTLELLKRFIGVENVSGVSPQAFEKFGDQFAVFDLFNKMANVSDELNNVVLQNTAIFKMLTGQSTISAPRKWKDRINFVNFATLIFATNDLPRTKDDTLAFWSRWVYMEFPYTFLSQKDIARAKDKTNLKLKDDSIVKKLSNPAELSGLLNVALDSLENILKNGDFSTTDTMQEIKKIWIRKSDSFKSFLLEEIIEDWDSQITKTDLRKAYGLYCKKYKLKIVGDKWQKTILTETYSVSEEREQIKGIISATPKCFL